MAQDCIFCHPESFGKRKLDFEDKNGFWYLVVPEEVGSFGQVLLVVRKRTKDFRHITEISDPELLSDKDRLLSVMKGISTVANKMKNKLLDQVGRSVEKVYVTTQCEGAKHLHFQIYPRYQKDLTHNEFLYACELEEARWQSPAEVEPSFRIETGRQIIQRYSNFVEENQFLYSNDYKRKKMDLILLELNNVLRE